MTTLRRHHYNAEVVGRRLVHENLLILRARPDGPLPVFQPGQYTTLGLGVWEERVDEISFDGDRNGESEQLIRRAYSVSCPLLDDTGELARCGDLDFLEFYIALVSRPKDDPPSLTPRLFSLKEGDRLAVGNKFRGRYTLAPVGEEDDVIFAATGTGEAPHNGMLTELLASGHRGRIVSAICVRHRFDLAYLEPHRELERRYENYQYIPLTTREPENINPRHPDYVGKQYLQDLFDSNAFADQTGWQADPAKTHLFLCGNPAMIGLPTRDAEGKSVFPKSKGMVELLTDRGFKLNRPRDPGNIHFEKYW